MRRARIAVVVCALVLYACSLADGGFLANDDASTSVQDASIFDAAVGDETVDFEDASLDAATCSTACPTGFSCLDGVCADVAARGFRRTILREIGCICI